MPLMVWSKALDLGIEDMNGEHKHLLDLMNRLYDMCDKGADVALTSIALRELIEYTQEHFAHEEKYLASIKFPELEVHKEIHKDLLKKLEEYKELFKRGASSIIKKKFFNFLKFWLSSHIQGIDMKYGRFVKSKSAS